jgi:tetratricopeptide (TPR) repeat protein
MNKGKSGILVSTLLLLTSIHTQSAGNDSVRHQFDMQIAAAAGDSTELIEAYFAYGKYFVEQGEIDYSIQKFEKAWLIAKTTDNPTQMVELGNFLGNMYAARGNFAASNDTYQRALEAAEENRDSGNIAKISMNLASNLNFTGQYEEAVEYGLYALKIKESSNNLERICYHYIAMGNIFRENSNTAKWEEYVQKAYRMKDVEGCASFADIAKIYNSLGGIEVQREDLEKALLYYDSLLIFSMEAEYQQGISTALTNSAGVYRQLGSSARALELAIQAEAYFGENPYDVIFSNNFKAELYQESGEYERALELANQNICIAEIENYSTEKLKCLFLLYELNYLASDYEKAFYWNDSLRTTEGLLRDEDVRQSMEELEAKYETEKKERQIDLLMAENKLKTQRIKAGTGLLAVLLIVIFLITYIWSIRKRQAALIRNDLQQQVLRTQMNPHFIFNVLGSIQNYMHRNNTREASRFLSQFASLIRATLQNSAVEVISLADELKMLKDYIELEKMRSPEIFEYDIVYDEGLEVDLIQIPPMLVQPFVENAIKHGFKNPDRNGVLKLQITDKVHWIEFVVEDNGDGLPEKEAKMKDHRSMGIEIFEKRRKLIQNKYKKEFSYEILNLSDCKQGLSGLRVILTIPVLND